MAAIPRRPGWTRRPALDGPGPVAAAALVVSETGASADDEAPGPSCSNPLRSGFREIARRANLAGPPD